VRFGLIENEHRTRQAVRGIREMFKQDGLLWGFLPQNFSNQKTSA
jgi:alanine-synthesizing transaminase